jgi:O-antigen ligase
MMEFGWPGLLLIGGLIFLLVLEGVKAWRQPHGAAAVLFMVLAVIILHGGHLMILYDKPSLVLVAVVGAVYANIRPWRRRGPVVSVSNQNCML